MRYISPIRFYTHCGIDISDKESLSATRLKKLVGVEFSMASDGIIAIDGHDYNKNDILLDLENPNWENNIKYHLDIWETQSLLRFLEEDIAKAFEARKQWMAKANDAGFVDFVSPYFAEAYKNVSKKYLNPADFNTLRLWLSLLVFVNPIDQEEALASIRLFFDESVNLFRNINATTYPSRYDELKPWTNQVWQFFINEMPESLFYYREMLADAMLGFIADVVRTDFDLAYSLNSRLAKVEGLSVDIQEIVKKNQEILARAQTNAIDAAYSETHGSEESSGSGVGSIFSIIFGVIAIIKLLFALSRCAG